MLVGLMTIGSARPEGRLQAVGRLELARPTSRRRPGRGRSGEQASATAQTPSAPHAASPMRGGIRCNIGGNS